MSTSTSATVKKTAAKKPTTAKKTVNQENHFEYHHLTLWEVPVAILLHTSPASVTIHRIRLA